ncbi:MAG: polyribonucleotide nucleotidyltransferase [Eubacteriales bacterium]|nr:polyribonucleotide nucleotidyltransferase [Eubacteriales bacterium]MDY3333049.1 polyribonucleotide nucleotidyltransferase [Gallibacter sp.]
MKFENYKVFRTAIGGKLLELEIGKVCEMTNGQVMVRYADTVVNVTVVASAEPRPDVDFFPLSCNYEEKMYAAGKIPGGYIKREGRPSEIATLNSRLMDRPLRPLFPKGFYNDVQVVATVMSMDEDAPSEIAAMIGSSVALSISDIPWDGPTGSVLVGMVDGKFIINPSKEEREASDLHLVVAGTKDAIMMVEAGANEVAEDVMLDAIMFAHEEIKSIVAFIEDVTREIGKAKFEVELAKVPENIEKDVREFAESKMREAVKTVEKMERLANMDAVEVLTQEHFEEIYPDEEKAIAKVLYDITKEQVRKLILDDGIRPDNRKYDEIRPIWVDSSILPRTHGSALFKRGQTQALSVATLGMVSEGQRLDDISGNSEKRYMHHYNFPPYSVGEAKPMRSPGRREIGHGALAERAIVPVLPSKEEFPYAIRVVSDILASNGSTSQAAVCGSCLALMDAGVPIKAPVAGIAMGLVERVEEDGSSTMAILSDIQGMEDFLGDMDFKVAGTAKGITAIQMDIKVHGLSKKVLEDALEQARKGRLHIMGEMLAEIPEPRAELSPYAPRVVSISVDPDKVRLIIGPGGKMINNIIEKTGAKIDIEDDGTIYISSVGSEGCNEALYEIQQLVREVEVGEVYDGKVVRIMNFGAFIEILPGKEGLLHISKMAKHRVEKVEDEMNIGDVVKVKVSEIDAQDRINLVREGI